MRSLLLVLLLGLPSGSALADPPAKRTIDVPAGDQERATQPLGKRPQDPATGARAMDGSWSAGNVLEPPALADARPYPRGMVIAPPDTGDRMGIPPGTRGLPGPRTLAERLVHGLDRGLGSLLDLVMTSHL